MLGRGMTSTEVRYFIVPVGEYKVRIENSPTGLDEIRPVQVSMGQTQNILIGTASLAGTTGRKRGARGTHSLRLIAYRGVMP